VRDHHGGGGPRGPAPPPPYWGGRWPPRGPRGRGPPPPPRAVGQANGRNPIAVIVPCHRVIGADGSLTGYGGGLERKRWLLELEAGVLSIV